MDHDLLGAAYVLFPPQIDISIDLDMVRNYGPNDPYRHWYQFLRTMLVVALDSTCTQIHMPGADLSANKKGANGEIYALWRDTRGEHSAIKTIDGIEDITAPQCLVSTRRHVNGIRVPNVRRLDGKRVANDINTTVTLDLDDEDDGHGVNQSNGNKGEDNGGGGGRNNSGGGDGNNSGGGGGGNNADGNKNGRGNGNGSWKGNTNHEKAVNRPEVTLKSLCWRHASPSIKSSCVSSPYALPTAATTRLVAHSTRSWTMGNRSILCRRNAVSRS